MCISYTYRRHKDQHMYLACGKCYKCVERTISDWSFRLKQEERHSLSSYFVTLTYAPQYLVLDTNYEPVFIAGHFQNYIKRLRKLEKNNDTIRYFTVGEKGDEYGRTHWHMLIYNVTNPNNIIRAWSKGIVDIRDHNSGRIMYILKYLHGTEDICKLTSTGLGDQFLTPRRIKHHQNKMQTYVMDEGYKKPLPRYYAKKLFSNRYYKDALTIRYQKHFEKYNEEKNDMYILHRQKTFELNKTVKNGRKH